MNGITRSLSFPDCPRYEFKQSWNEIHVWAVDLDHWEAPVKNVEQMLPASEQEKSERFRFAMLKRRYIKCHLLLRILLGKYLGVDFYQQEFYLNRHGKPFLKKAKDGNPLFFNLSNCENFCVCVFTQDGDVGVDVEKICDLPDMGGIVERFFSPLENKKFCSLPEHSRKKTFFKYWTRKEALLKARGVGLSSPMNNFAVVTEQDDTAEIFVKTSERNVQTEWTLQDIKLGDGFASAMALQGKHYDFAERLRCFQLA